MYLDERRDMAKYMLLIQGDPRQWDAMTPDQWTAHGAAHGAFSAEAGARILGGEQLETATTATTLRADGAGGVVTTDGPFLETKEVLGGFYLLEAADLDEAIKLASLLPEVRAGHSGVEIRPVVEHG
ncbi:YciI family protein [Actinoplanes sp. NPDC051470]|uniref:YciI family protein n=1 Tax=unclassified Actinoplanes TaxID=2626549 RepID=UPI00342AFE28